MYSRQCHDSSRTAVGLADIRLVTELDLLGRRPIDTEVESVASYLRGKCVLWTGAGGSIGSEICRQVNRFAPRSLVMLDRDASLLHDVQMSIYREAMVTVADSLFATSHKPR